MKTKKSWDTKIETIQFLIHLDLSNYFNSLLHEIMKIPNPPIFLMLKEAVLKLKNLTDRKSNQTKF